MDSVQRFLTSKIVMKSRIVEATPIPIKLINLSHKLRCNELSLHGRFMSLSRNVSHDVLPFDCFATFT